MLLSNIERLSGVLGDYAVLADCGGGISVHSQHENLEAAMEAMLKGDLGNSMAVVKLCRIETPVEKKGE